MKITAQEEYGLRILLRIARSASVEGLSIPKISEAEGLSNHYVAKLCRILRLAGLIQSSRGKDGGYLLTRPAESIRLNHVLDALGGRLYEGDFCSNHAGNMELCSNSVDCSIRSLWQILQNQVDSVLGHLTISDLLDPNQPLVQIQSPTTGQSLSRKPNRRLQRVG